MKPIVVHATLWTGDHPTEAGEEAAAMFIRGVRIGGEWIPYTKATASLEWDGPEDFVVLRLEGVPTDFVIEPDDYLLGSDREAGILLLPIRGWEVGMAEVPVGVICS